MNFESVPLLMHGRTWPEMPVGFQFRTDGRTITETDLISFVSLAGVNEPLFFDERFGQANGYAGRLVPGMMTFSYAEGLVIQTGSIHGTGLAFLHMELDIKAPTFVGDTIAVVVRSPSREPLRVATAGSSRPATLCSSKTVPS